MNVTLRREDFRKHTETGSLFNEVLESLMVPESSRDNVDYIEINVNGFRCVNVDGAGVCGQVGAEYKH